MEESRKKGCEKCKGPLVYLELFDATACKQCNEWRESKCSTKGCDMCWDRPDKPFNTK